MLYDNENKNSNIFNNDINNYIYKQKYTSTGLLVIEVKYNTQATT